ncbi:uncharacterized protein LOC106644410 isoform X2 [Copidosoma floridanum]|uniref:uncharacterized protein LOC106644410 isoform X2 n=1 Tax=Copidosoma floridanum TaxID=29053 RepID=UPI0006C9D4D7|nr:uncharacterized protein LOC106644410 isoform X2 [Copidosoma floridanum]
MKGRAALLLVLLALVAVPPSSATTASTPGPPTRRASTASPTKKIIISTSTEPVYSTKALTGSTDSEIAKILSVDPKEVLVENKRSEAEDDNTEQMQEEMAKVIKAQAKKGTKPVPIRLPLGKSSATAASHGAPDSQAMKALLEAEGIPYNNDEIDGEDEDDDEDEYDDDDEDEDDDEDDDGGIADDEEEVMSGCPDYCRCDEEFAAPTSARCTKLQDDQDFSSGIIHLKIESAGDIRLGPLALRKLGLKQLKSISIVDTRILELDRTAFDGLRELDVVNLTHNGLTYVHPDTFQNNSKLTQLTIADNPLKVMSSRRSSNDYLLNAPSVTDLDFSSNHVNRLPRRAFAKMPNLAYISLRNNNLNNIERDLFGPLDSLVELDLSHNNLADLPTDVFKGKNLQILKISGNSLTSLSVIRSSKLVTLDVSMNRLKVITKDDLNGVPYLEQLFLSANNLRKIHPHAFSHLDQLIHLDLSDNSLVNLSDHHFRANSRLQVLMLSNNADLETLPVFRTNAQEFERFSIYRFECENCGLTFIESGTFDAMPAMTRLNLGHNNLTELPRDLLRPLSALRELDLSRNRLEELDVDAFKGANSLAELSLGMNSFVSGLKLATFLKTPNLLRLDLSSCGMQRVWNDVKASPEPRSELKLEDLRFLSLNKNNLRRVTLGEISAMPNLSGLDLFGNPLQCDEELSQVMQRLNESNVTPIEAARAMGSMKHDFDYDGYSGARRSEPVQQWSDLANCDAWIGGPPPRPVPRKSPKPTQASGIDAGESIFDEPGPFIKFDLTDDADNKLDFGPMSKGSHNSKHSDDKIEFAWNSEDQEYEELAGAAGVRYREWYTDALWPAVTVILITLAVLLLAAHLAVCLAKRRGSGPVIRTPMILRPNLVVDSKNCGLVYKPLQEEIATPHMPKRGSFYSSSTFHYDKIVPESV